MKTIKQQVTIGFDETNDALVTVSPAQAGSGVSVELISPVKRQYGEHIYNLILSTVKELEYTDLHIAVQDKGAWDYALKARIATALERGSAE